MISMEKTIFVLIIIIKGIESFTCSSTAGIKLNTFPVDNKKPESIRQKTYGELREFKLVSKSLPFRFTVSYTYCPPVELGAFEDCQYKQETIMPNEGNSVFSIDSNSCIGPRFCGNGACDGLNKQECFTYSNSSEVKAGNAVNHPLSHSWVSHRCTRKMICETKEEVTQIIAISRSRVGLVHPDLGICQANIDDKHCCWENKFCVHFKIEVTMSPDHIEMTCLSMESESYCMMAKSRIAIRMISDDEGVLDNQHITLRVKLHPLKAGMHTSYGRVSDVEAVEAVYDTLEYEALQMEVNNAMLENRMKQLESIMSHGLRTQDFSVQGYIKYKYGLNVKKHNETQGEMFFFVCGSSNHGDPTEISQIQWTTIYLFDQQKTESVILNHPILLSYKRYIGEAPKEYMEVSPDSTRLESTFMGVEGLIDHVLSWFKEWFVAGTCIVFWISFFVRR